MTEQLCRPGVQLQDQAGRRHRRVTDRCQLIEGVVLAAQGVEVEVRRQQIFVLQLQLDLMNLELMENPDGIEAGLAGQILTRQLALGTLSQAGCL